MMHLILCGMAASGKTTIGQKVAEKFKLPFYDTDQLIESEYAKNESKLSCREIYLKHGADYFRDLEKKQLLSFPKEGTAVIAVGGGTLNDPENIETLKSYGQLVYLKCSMDVLWERIRRREMPAYLDPKDPYHSFLQIFLQRVPFYEKAAHGIVNCHKLSLEEIVWEVTLLAPFLKSQLGANHTEKLSV